MTVETLTEHQRLAGLIRSAHHTVKRVVRVLPPIDTGWPVEVLYLSFNGHPMTARVYDGVRGEDPEILVEHGW